MFSQQLPLNGKLEAEPRTRHIADGTGIINALGLQADDADALRKDLLSDSSEPAEPVPFAESITPGWWTALDEGRLQPFFRKQAAAHQVRIVQLVQVRTPSLRF